MALKKELDLDNDDVAIYLHTALRKCCDSDPTTIAYNIIRAMRGGTWMIFVDWCCEKWREDEVIQFKNIAQEWMENFYDYVDRETRDKLHEGEWPLLIALSITFRLFEEYDWGGFTSFIEEWEGDKDAA